MNTVIELSEYSRATAQVAAPSPGDLDLASRLNTELSRKLELRWLLGNRLEVVSTSWVGVVRLENVTISVRPKFAGNELGVIQMARYANGAKGLRRVSGDRTIKADGTDLLDVICLLLAEEAQLLLRDGLMRDYVTEEESLPALRGSLRYRDQATRRFGQLDILECRYDDFRSDILENQLLRTGLQVAARLASDKALSKRLRRLELTAADLTDAGPVESAFYSKRLSYSRRNERYRRAHQLALLLLDNIGVNDLFSSGTTKSFSFLLDMNNLFEAFVSALVSEAFAVEPWQVTSQRKIRSVIQDRTTGRRYASIIPDIVMSNGDSAVPFDCKYKLYGSGRKISTSDIFQSFLYAYALSKEAAGESRAGIIYPSMESGVSPQLSIKSVDGQTTAQLTGIGIDVVGILNSMNDADTWVQTLGLVRTSISEVINPIEVSKGS